ncbi:quinone oxidoreductase family protein [Aspergillus brunneoviolaceus CBS 621.78]|uniref:Quinone oxidoreductase n=1 Tax=Aspergillus brunneoviolaceus CBS 621.78 TaxID=1450534 RepID=A0ACD1G5G9_9EURO|nr:quinone oxidoreductase [Aspergillus brunneoviolaceus CBS 621.78]RAH44465.1 quinone oxidoreductase [Aspergillus brunneoviolaceus CBS 621.78]
MSVPQTMKAVQVEKLGGPEVLEFKTDQPVPSAQEGQVLVKNHISGVNYIDTYFRTGLYPSAKPEILGREGAGTIVALGPGPNPYNLQVGDRVAWLSTGGYAEYTAVPMAKTVKIPEGLSDEDVMAAFLSGLTVITLAKETYPVKQGEWVLLHAAAGGAGTLMTQVLKSIGAKVIGTAGGPEKCELAKSLGADVVIDYRSEAGKDWPQKVKEITGGQGVDVVFDSVGKDTWEGSLEAVKRKGTIVWFGNASGPVPPLPLQKLSPKCVKVARPQLFGYIETREEFEFYVNELFSLLQSNKLKARVHKVYPLEDVAEAHRDLEGRKTTGKLLLKSS